jgi:hypothetical protein
MATSAAIPRGISIGPIRPFCLKLTRGGSRKVIVNMSWVVTIEPDSEGSIITFNNKSFLMVDESPDAIMWQLATN